ncbi:MULTISPECIES: ABC transporter substrate-binding protein [Deinococcus]|uniref:ABC transporter substrate-binding protein n=1 Tax=Deinococcus rufus TaxID=2136097 RepID=A0ABV7Z8C4_9DEIO|nr:extracellular solute-binding protein [Deinococcus sp. AB2017081]WQE97313.1 extracellular solute-binding protein [Deinococcus sp. AB2017081]
MRVPTRPIILLTAACLSTAGAATLELWNDKAADWGASYTKVADALRPGGIDFKQVRYPDTTSYQAAVRTALSARRPPDAFTWWSGYRMKDLVDSGQLEDLTPLWTKYIKSGEYKADAAKPFTFGGKIYGVPNNVAYWVVYYNKAVYAKVGITPPTTWAQLLQNNDKLKAAGVTPFAQTVDGRWQSFIWFEQFLANSDPAAYNKLMVGQIKYTDPAVTKVFTTWADWIRKGYLSDPTLSTDASKPGAMQRQFAQGKIANILNGDWMTPQLVAAGAKANTDFGVFILPSMTPGTTPALISESSPIVVPKNSANKAAALKLADAWMGTKAQTLWTNLQSFSPVNLKSTPDSALTRSLVTQLKARDYTLLNRIWEATPTEIIEPGVDEFAKFMLDPRTQGAVQANLQKLADAYWSTHK